MATVITFSVTLEDGQQPRVSVPDVEVRQLSLPGVVERVSPDETINAAKILEEVGCTHDLEAGETIVSHLKLRHEELVADREKVGKQKEEIKRLRAELVTRTNELAAANERGDLQKASIKNLNDELQKRTEQYQQMVNTVHTESTACHDRDVAIDKLKAEYADLQLKYNKLVENVEPVATKETSPPDQKDEPADDVPQQLRTFENGLEPVKTGEAAAKYWLAESHKVPKEWRDRARASLIARLSAELSIETMEAGELIRTEVGKLNNRPVQPMAALPLPAELTTRARAEVPQDTPVAAPPVAQESPQAPATGAGPSEALRAAWKALPEAEQTEAVAAKLILVHYAKNGEVKRSDIPSIIEDAVSSGAVPFASSGIDKKLTGVTTKLFAHAAKVKIVD